MDRIKEDEERKERVGDGLKLEEDGGDEKGLEEMVWLTGTFKTPGPARVKHPRKK